jgi:hypothetical protein
MIAVALNERKIPTTRGGDCEWTSVQVKRVLERILSPDDLYLATGVRDGTRTGVICYLSIKQMPFPAFLRRKR